MGVEKVTNKFFLSLLTILIVLSSVGFAASPFFFKGIAHVNGSLAPNGTIIEVFSPSTASTPISSVTIGEGQLAGLDLGKYVISFESDSGNNVSFKVNGIALIAANGTNTTNQTLGTEIVTTNFNLSINKSANTLACTFAVGCTGAFCVHSICRSASTFCGDAFCDSGESCSTDDSACSSGQACTNGCAATSSGGGGGGGGSSGGGGGGGGTTLPSVTQTINNIMADTPKSVLIAESKLPVSQVEITTSVSLTNVQLVIKEITQPSGVSPAIPAAAGNIYKHLDITSSASSTQLVKMKIKFSVTKSWLTANSIDLGKVVLNRLVGTTWIKLLTTKTGEDAVNVFYEAESPGLSVFAITGERSAAPPIFAVCGNNVFETGEECDELQLGGQTCASKGFESGTLKCTACKFDTSQCVSAQPETPVAPVERPSEGRPIELPPVTDIGGIILIVVILAVLLFVYKLHMKKTASSAGWS